MRSNPFAFSMPLALLAGVMPDVNVARIFPIADGRTKMGDLRRDLIGHPFNRCGMKHLNRGPRVKMLRCINDQPVVTGEDAPVARAT